MGNVKIQNIEKSFGALKILNEVSLSIQDGEFVSLVGPSGCGKSTLLRIIAGLEPQTSGDVFIGERNVNSVGPSQRDLAMVFQSYALYPHLTVKENMIVPLKLRDLSMLQRLFFVGRFLPGSRQKLDVIHKAVRETAEILKITDLLDRKPGQLSGGQRQRVAVGRAMVRNPTAFLMDEPLSNLDAALRVHMRTEIADLHRQLKSTFVYVTHDQAEALTMSDRIAVMMDGNILQFDTPEKVYKDPQDLRVAEFIGSPKMNLLPAQMNEYGQITLSDGTAIPGKASGPAGSVTVGVRPEHTAIGAQLGPVITTTIRHVENLGSDLFVHSQQTATGKTVVTRAKMNQLREMIPGKSAAVALDPTQLYIFGADKKRIIFEVSQ